MFLPNALTSRNDKNQLSKCRPNVYDFRLLRTAHLIIILFWWRRLLASEAERRGAKRSLLVGGRNGKGNPTPSCSKHLRKKLTCKLAAKFPDFSSWLFSGKTENTSTKLAALRSDSPSLRQAQMNFHYFIFNLGSFLPKDACICIRPPGGELHYHWRAHRWR